MIEVNVYYYLQYYSDECERYFLIGDFKGRGLMIIPENEKAIVLCKTVITDSENCGGIVLYLVYTTCEVKDIATFKKGRPIVLERIGKAELRKDPDDDFGFPFGIPDLVQECNKNSERFFLKYTRDLEESYTGILSDFRGKFKGRVWNSDEMKDKIKNFRL